ncbi:histidine phosphatase family protein [Salinibacillus xinjiangensis]|uniref:Histidine phosphatase family protein n=1 Tax=Salinibacillus xinjiangensis TaxID=1229268 RepID=A0A6G1X9L3_9BACI|nr:histidine phosphatase family protein [Salinibacillus xinjiangensis]MRG87595.1 histidine phosphatase family protein [Salinibacillus xinjiangensis]
MEIVFIRHGQGEHTLDLPKSLHTPDPALTEEGIIQAKTLKNHFPLSQSDVIIVSPIRRTLQTARIWSEGIKCQKIVSPLVSPRMFPQNPEWQTLPCDEILTKELIKDDFNDFYLEEELSNEWWLKGINKLPEKEFKVIAEGFLEWCKHIGNKRIYIVSHDGTITSYRQLITGRKLSRNDFPKETGFLKVNL